MAHNQNIFITDYNINDLDINLEEHLSNFKFETIMGTISVDTRCLYRGVPSGVFNPLKVKIKQDGVKKIQHFHLPKEHATVTDPRTGSTNRNTNVYNSLVGDIVKDTVVENIYAPYVMSVENIRSLSEVLNKEAKCNVNVYFPHAVYREGTNIGAVISGCSEKVTIFLPPEWKNVMAEECNFVRLMDEKRTRQVQRANTGEAVALKTFKGEYLQEFVETSLYSDTTPSRNLFFQDHAYKFLRVRKTLDVVNEIKIRRSQEPSDGRSSEPNIVIGILDSGLRTDHLAFAGRILDYKNFVHGILPSTSAHEDEMMECEQDEGYDMTTDRRGHGTFCASIAVGDAFGCRLPADSQPAQEREWKMGVAPFANIICGKVASWNGFTCPKWVTEGIEWLLSFPDGTDKQVDIISLSLGFQHFDEDLRKVILKANLRGKIIVCAASNAGRQQQTSIAFPARFGDVICVGSHTRNGQPSASSPTGREIDFLAPGEDIWGASSALPDAVVAKSGTSVATPFVAGIAAIVIKAAHHIGGDDLRRKVSNTTVMREILRKMASMPGHHDEAMGYGNLNPYNLFGYGEDFFQQIVSDIYNPNQM